MAQRSLSARRRALIVEDEPMIALSLEANMRDLGYDTCDLAADGQSAVSHAMSNQPDVVLMSISKEAAKVSRPLSCFEQHGQRERRGRSGHRN